MKRLLLLITLLPLGLKAQNIVTIAGTGVAGYSGDGAAATAAKLDNPSGLAFDSYGNYYISDCSNHVIRKVTPAGVISTVVGTHVAGYSGDGGPATAAQINRPIKVIFDAADNMYIGELYGNRVRKVTSGGIISTVAGGGTGGDGGPATAASLNGPCCMAFDALGNFYIGEYYSNKIRKVNTSGIISTYAGTGVAGYSGDGGPATNAKLNGLFDIAIDPEGNLYIADAANNRVRMVSTLGIMSTFSGNGTAAFSGDGGPASAAKVNNPAGLEIDPAGNIYIADQGNRRVRKVTTAGIISTIAGNGTYGSAGDGGPATAAELSNTNEVLVMADGTILICDDLNNKIRALQTSCPVFSSSSPLSDTIQVGDTVSFSIATTATAPTFQWQKLTATGYVSLTNTTPYSGVYTNTLTISGATLGLDSTYYRCLITVSEGCPGDSTAAAILRVVKSMAVTKEAKELDLIVYPNPADNTLYVEVADKNNLTEVQLYDLLGRKLLTCSGKGKLNIDIGDLPAGAYIIRVLSGREYAARQVLKK